MFYLLNCLALVTKLMSEACRVMMTQLLLWLLWVLTLGSKDTSAIFLNKLIVTEVVSAKLLMPLSYNIC